MLISYVDCMKLVGIIVIALIITKAIKMIIESFFIKGNNNAQMMMLPPKPKMVDILTELDMLIQIECVGLIDLPQNVKNIPLITDFREIQMELIHNVLEALSTSFWMECNRVGLKREYIITYTTRRANEEILKFIKKYNYDLTKVKPDFFALIDREKTMRDNFNKQQ